MVEIKDKLINLDGRKIPLLSGEMHYWRLEPNLWVEILNRIKELGLDIVSSYVPWEYHEYQKGKFDFSGKTSPKRDLKGFLELLGEIDMWAIIRPGPYIYSEWKNRGIPDYIAKYHRLHPVFLEAASKYIKKVCECLKDYLFTAGGNVILLQADNEIDPFVTSFLNQLGLNGGAGLFQEFLETEYGSINSLNEAWGTSYSKFEEAKGVITPIRGDRKYLRRYFDFKRFTWWYVNKYAHWIIQKYRRCGIDVPIYLNTYPEWKSQNWYQLSSKADLIGVDVYPSGNFHIEKSAISMDRHRFMDLIRYMKTFSELPYIAEFQSGFWHGWSNNAKIPSATHYNLITLSALAAGATGWNWYMLVNRDNWYMSPVNEWGRVRPPLYDTFKSLIKLYRYIKPYLATKLTDTAVTFDFAHKVVADVTWEVGMEPNDPVTEALYEADIEYEFYNLDTGSIEKELMFYSGQKWMSQENQERLKKYVEKGGKLVLFTSYPTKDDEFKDFNLLGIKRPDGVIHWPGQISIDLSGYSGVVNAPFFIFNDVPGTPINCKLNPCQTAMVEDYYQYNLMANSEFTIGYMEERGEGKLMVIGAYPTPGLMRGIHKSLGVKLYSQSLTEKVHSTVFEKERSFYLIVINNSREAKRAIIKLSDYITERSSNSGKDLLRIEKLKLSGSNLGIEVGSKQGTIIELKKTTAK